MGYRIEFRAPHPAFTGNNWPKILEMHYPNLPWIPRVGEVVVIDAQEDEGEELRTEFIVMNVKTDYVTDSEDSIDPVIIIYVKSVKDVYADKVAGQFDHLKKLSEQYQKIHQDEVLSEGAPGGHKPPA